MLQNWKTTVPQKCEELLKLPLFSRSKCQDLELNFHPEASKNHNFLQYFVQFKL